LGPSLILGLNLLIPFVYAWGLIDMLICVILKWHLRAAVYHGNYLLKVTDIFVTFNVYSYKFFFKFWSYIPKTFWYCSFVCQSAILKAPVGQACYNIEFCIKYNPLLLCFSGPRQKVVLTHMNLLTGLSNVRNHFPGIVLHLIDSILSQINVFDNYEVL
jgi:hypothetical protein